MTSFLGELMMYFTIWPVCGAIKRRVRAFHVELKKLQNSGCLTLLDILANRTQVDRHYTHNYTSGRSINHNVIQL